MHIVVGSLVKHYADIEVCLRHLDLIHHKDHYLLEYLPATAIWIICPVVWLPKFILTVRNTSICIVSGTPIYTRGIYRVELEFPKCVRKWRQCLMVWTTYIRQFIYPVAIYYQYRSFLITLSYPILYKKGKGYSTFLYCRKTVHIWHITPIFARWHHSLTSVTPVKYEHGSDDVTDNCPK